MKSRFLKLLGMAWCVILSVSSVAPAPAANINVNASECQPQTYPIDDIVHTDQGIATASTVNSDRWVSCAVLRSPLASGATSGSFYIDGDAQNGAWTVCVIASDDYTGAFLGSASFASPGPHFDILLNMPAAQLGYWAYTSITCVLPAHGNGALRGVTSLQ